jgi:SAM-dependent methyltransferase
MNKIEKLKEMYANTSKHSNYQILASDLQKYLKNDDIEVKSRNETIRLNYFLKNVNIKNKKVLDIGGNTGYFTFEFLKNGADTLEYYEGNQEHAKFVQLASEVLGYTEQLTVYNKYYNFDQNEQYDVVLLLNVLHHLGDDFGDDKVSKEKALETIIEHMKAMAKQTDILVFQLGFNWKGDRDLPLFENGTKQELIDFIASNLNN